MVAGAGDGDGDRSCNDEVNICHEMSRGVTRCHAPAAPTRLNPFWNRLLRFEVKKPIKRKMIKGKFLQFNDKRKIL